MVLHPTQQKIGHFRDVPQANLLEKQISMEKHKLTQQKHTFANQKKCAAMQNKQKLKSGLVASHDIRPGNGEGLFLFRRFINLSLTYLLRHLPTYLQPQHLHGQRNHVRNLSFLSHNVILNVINRKMYHDNILSPKCFS